MNILDYFRPTKKTSANIAKERLQIIVAHQRKKNEIDLEKLQRELIAVVSKYLPINEQEVTVEVERDENRSILELNVVLPDLPEER